MKTVSDVPQGIIESNTGPTASWVNGQPADRISIFDRGLTYGDGVFETIRVNTAPVLLSLHLARLARGTKVLSIPVDFQFLKQEINRFLAGRSQGILKIVITRGEGGRGYAPPQEPSSSRILSWHSLTTYPESHSLLGVNLFDCETTLAQGGRLAGIKHLNRLEQVLARSEWGLKNFQEGLVCDDEERIVEAVFSNILMVKNGELHTPGLAKAGVSGVMREWLLNRLSGEGVTVMEREIPKKEIYTMDEVFLSNSVFGVWPVRSFGSITWAPGPVTKLSQRLISNELMNDA